MERGSPGLPGARKGGSYLVTHMVRVSAPRNCGKLRQPVRTECGLTLSKPVGGERHGER